MQGGRGCLAGRKALITGAAGGIGEAVARAFAREGAAVALGYRRSAARAGALAEELGRQGVRAAALQADVADPAQAEALVRRAQQALGGLDILVNNAGTALYRTLLDTSPQEWQGLLAVHLTGAYACSRAAIPGMLARGWGRIVNVSSLWGLTGAAGEVAYSTAKAGLIGFTRALAQELGRGGITVNALAPGAIATGMLAGLDPSERAELAERTALGRLGTPAEVAEAAVFLASDAAAYVTGQVLCPDGGLRA